MLDKSFVKSLSIALSGGVLVQLIGVLTAPIITRIYSPEVFGVFSSITAYASVLVPLLILSYSLVLVLPKLEKNAFCLLAAAVVICSVLTVLLFLVVTTVDLVFINEWGWAIIIIAWHLSIMQLYSYWFVRKNKFSFRARYLVTQAIVITCSKIIFGYGFASVESLVFSTMIPGTLLIVYLGYKTLKDSKYLIEGESINKVVKRSVYNVKKYFYIVKFRTPQNMLASFNSMLPLLVIPMVYNAYYVGIFALTRTVLMMPGMLISTSVGDVIYPKLNRAVSNKSRISNGLTKICLGISLLGFVPLIFLNIWGEELFSYVFGVQWILAGQLSSILSFWVFISLVNKPLIVLIPIFNLEKKFLINSVVNALLGMVCFFVSKLYGFSFIESMQLYTLFLIVPQIYIVITVCVVVRNYENLVKEVK